MPVLTQSIIDSDPYLQSLIKAYGPLGQAGRVMFQQAINQYLPTKGYTFPEHYTLSAQGQFEEQPSDLNVVGALLAPGAVLGGAGLASALGGLGTAEGTAAATTEATAPTAAADLSLPGGVNAVAEGSQAFPAAAATATPSVWKSFAMAAIPAVAGLIGAKIQSNATTDAANIQAQTAANALALQKQIYEQNRADLSPYRATGSGALVNLNKLAGVTPINTPDLPTPSTTPTSATPSTTTPAPPATANTPQSLNTLATPPPATGTPSTSGPVQSAALVTLRAPDGTVQQVPQTQSGYYISKGAVAV